MIPYLSGDDRFCPGHRAQAGGYGLIFGWVPSVPLKAVTFWGWNWGGDSSPWGSEACGGDGVGFGKGCRQAIASASERLGSVAFSNPIGVLDVR